MKNANISRRQLLQASAALGCLAAAPLSVVASEFGGPDQPRPSAVANPLKPPAEGAIPVAFLVSDGAVVIDFAGPWEVFPGRHDPRAHGHALPALHRFRINQAHSGQRWHRKSFPTTLSKMLRRRRSSSSPAQSAPSEAVMAWVRKSAKTADVTMSVCTGAYLLAQTGLLAGKSATTHHGSYVDFARKYPDIQMKRGARFVEDGNLATAGGLSSGIDLALRVVERYYGREVATQGGLRHGIPGSRLEECGFKLGLCQTAQLRGWPSPLCRVLHGH